METVISTSILRVLISPTTGFQEVYAAFSQKLNLPHAVLRVVSIMLDRIGLDSYT